MKWTIYEQRRLRKAISDIRSWTDLSEWYETLEVCEDDIYWLQQVKWQEYANDKITDLLFN